MGNGGYRNDTTPYALREYIYNLSSTVSAAIDVCWNPTVDAVCEEIDSNRPVMLGFAAGSYFSQTEGHMTMCYGYQTINGDIYSYLASGWYTYGIYVVWDSSINDCMITVQLY